MPKENISDPSGAKPGETFITFNPYAFKKTGIVQSSTYIKIDNYYLICIPWRISSSEMYLIASLNVKERELFQKYKNTHCSVYISYLDGRHKTEFKILIQTTIRFIGPLANKENMCYIQLGVRMCPEPLRLIIDEYLKHSAAVQNSFENHTGKKVPLDNAETLKLLGFNDYAEIRLKNKEIPVRVVSLSVNELDFIISSVHDSVAGQNDLSMKLYFIQNRFFIRGRVAASEPFGNIYQKYTVQVEFNPELVDILDLYFATSYKRRQPEQKNVVNGLPLLDRMEDFEELEIV